MKLWESATGHEQTFVGSEEMSIDAIAFHPEGQMLAVGGLYQHAPVIWLWDLATKTVVQRLGETEEHIASLAFSPDGIFLACGSGGGLGNLITLWQKREG
jgi:WD40 repeat protein